MESKHHSNPQKPANSITDHDRDAYAHGPLSDRLLIIHRQLLDLLEANTITMKQQQVDFNVRLTRTERFQAMMVGGVIVLSAMLSGGVLGYLGHVLHFW